MGLPSGNVALLFTDIESSMSLWNTDSAAMAASLEEHDRIMLEQIESAGGYIFTRAGDSFCAAFESALDAVAVAQRSQRRLSNADWPGPALRVRMGLHHGDVQLRAGDYFGPTVNLASRVADTGHGGQVVATSELLAAAGPIDASSLLGSYLLRGSDDRVELHQIGSGDFAALRADAQDGASVRFDEFEIDLAARRLSAGGQVIHVEPQVLDVLVHLVVHRDRLVSREELLDEIWGDQFVSMSALTTRVKQARRALGDDGRTQRYIRNERGRGYQFSGHVAPLEAPSSRPSRLATSAVPAATSFDRVQQPTPGRVGSVETAGSAGSDNTMFGRDDEVRAVGRLVEVSGITTVVGPGGVGKTTLVGALLARSATLGPDGAVVRLDVVRDESGLLPALTTALGLSIGDEDDPVIACAEWMSVTDQIVVLDNCEHLLDPVRDLVSRLLEAAPSARVLATSRQPLGLLGERAFRLQPFDVPTVDVVDDPTAWPCLELFAASARRAGGLHIVTDDEWGEVITLCRSLDGLPLAIELAASRVSTFGIRDLVSGLDDRLDWIRSRDVDAGERQRSLRSTIEWSFRFLDEEDLRVVAALSVFPAGLCLADVDALASDLGASTPTDEVVARLVDASVLVCTRRQGLARYSMLETIRQYGLDRLDGDSELREVAERRLQAHALDVARSERDAWTGEVDPRTRSTRRLHDEIPNLRSARRLMLEGGRDADVVRLAVGLCAFTEEVSLAELWTWHDTSQLVDLEELDVETRAGARMLEATAARNRGEIDGCRDAAADAAQLTDDRWIRGRALHTGAMAELYSGQMRRAGELWLESDDELGGCRGRLFAAMAAGFAGDLDAATSHLARCDIDHDSRVPIDLHTNVHLVRGELARVAGTGDARRELEQAVDVAREHGLNFSLGIAQVPLVTIFEADGDTAAAAAGYRELIGLFLRGGSWTQIWTTLRNAARLLVEESPAATLLVHVTANTDPRSPAVDDATRSESDRLVAIAEERLGADEAERIRRRAAIVPRAQMVREVSTALGTLTE